ncbi:hypothetical protein [Bacteroides ihuae]|uniref:hypothetical protein n=1 Tax=Bacteroides ihuae TaxID=1852362 RepID=UPI0008DA4ED3|nr:hypothetical protein [Bacteroides ihuae]
MYLKREREFQYHPGIEKIIEDVIGGGTIARADLVTAIFSGRPLDELPPLVIVVRDETTGVYHVLKTASVQAVAAADAVAYQVKKNHLFAVGDAVTIGGDYTKAANVISAIDKTDNAFDTITLAGTIGAAAIGAVLVQAKEKAAAGAAVPLHGSTSSELPITMNKVNLTIANQSSGLLVRGTVNGSVMPFPIDTALKARLTAQGIRIV